MNTTFSSLQYLSSVFQWSALRRCLEPHPVFQLQSTTKGFLMHGRWLLRGVRLFIFVVMAGRRPWAGRFCILLEKQTSVDICTVIISWTTTLLATGAGKYILRYTILLKV